MKHLTSIIILALAIFGKISCDCGCLKCSKHLQVVSPPYFPYQIIVNRPPCTKDVDGAGPLANPIVPPYIPVDYNDNAYNSNCEPYYAYKYTLQTVVPPPPPPPITGLVAKPDRLILQKTNCPVYTGDDGDCGVDLYRPRCQSIFQNGFYGGARYPGPTIVTAPKPGPILEPFGKGDLYKTLGCGCRYDHGSRKKREIPIIRKGMHFIMGLLPRFFKFPIEHTLKSLKYHEKNVPGVKPSKTFLQKLQQLNRCKRSLVFGGEKISLPFLRVTDIENSLEDESEEEEEESEEIVSRRHTNPREEFLKPLNFNHMFPHNPIYYLLNTPIRLLHHFHQFGQQISPVFKSVPEVFVNSRKYLRNLGKNLRNDVLDIASDFIGDFDDMYSHSYKPRRFKRSLDYEPDYSLVFGNDTEAKSRKKRYILKVVDEDEVGEFLREKLVGFVEKNERLKKETNKKKLVVERLAPKLIVDNNGRTFFEINGMKRPLFLRKKVTKKEEVEEKKEEEEDSEDVKEKINNIISQAKEKINQNPSASLQQPNVPNQIIKERINQILTEIQDLINLDFAKYSTIHSDLCKLENFKEILIKDWKKILIDEKSNDIPSKIRLLDDFKEMQILRDKAVENIASILSSGSNFMTKKLIKMLVRLQKLQCVIYRVVEDFGEVIKMGTEFDVRKEIKYVDFLTNLHFIVGQSKHDLENDLERERDSALENEMKVLDGLRKLLENNKNKPEKLYEEAQLLWEIKNIDKLQKDTISEMNEKISKGVKVRKELKILFDLLKQLENCEEKQEKLLVEALPKHKEETEESIEDKSEEIVERIRKIPRDQNTMEKIANT